MRRRRTAFVLLVVAVAVVGGLFAAGAWVAGMIESRIAALPGVSADAVRPGLLGIDLDGVRVRRDGHTARAAAVSLRPSLATLVSDGMVLDRLTIESPVIELAREGATTSGAESDGEQVAGGATAATAGADSAALEGTPRAGRRIELRRLLLRNGTVEIPADDAHPPVRLEDVRLEAADITWPAAPGRSPFSLRASVSGSDGGRLAARGWVARGGSRGRITLEAQRLPLVRLSPWFRDVGTTAPVSDGELGLECEIEIEGERYTAHGTLTLGRVEFEAPTGEFLGVPASVVERVFRVPENRVDLPFEVAGSTADDGNWRANLLRAAFRDAGRRLADGGAAQALDQARERLRQGDVEGAVDTLREAHDGGSGE